MGVTNFDIVQCDEFKLKTAGDVVAQGTQKNHIADASVTHIISSTFIDAEIKSALNALGGKINLIIAALEEFGITKSS